MCPQINESEENVEVTPTADEPAKKPVKKPAKKAAKPAKKAVKKIVKKAVKPAKKPAAKKPAAKKTPKTKQPAMKSSDFFSKEQTVKDRARAKELALTLIQFRVLRALGKAKEPLTYRGVQAVTGYYAMLAEILGHGARETVKTSLIARGLARDGLSSELRHIESGHDNYTFTTTAAGRKLLEKVVKK